MARIFFVFLALMCLSACGGGRTEDGAPPQEIPLEQDYNPSEQDVQTLEEEEAPSGVEASEAEPGQKELPVTAEPAGQAAGGSAASDGGEDSGPEQAVPSAPGETAPSLSEDLSGNAEPEGTKNGQTERALKITVGSHELLAAFADNSSAAAFRELLAQGPLTVEMEDYGGFEKVGPLGTTLERNDARITTEPGDVILYQGDQVTIYYGTNTWNFTRLARINDPSDLQEKLGEGTVAVTFSLE